jgi:teichoic acid transport system permease protein
MDACGSRKREIVNRMTQWLREAQHHRRVVVELAMNDFRTRFAGSYFGLLWALLQPLATILVFWFVFQVGFRTPPREDGTPYVLWLSVGLVPWFYFAEAWPGASGALIEYSYLVKKVVFRASLLPAIKVLSSYFIHLAFLFLVVVLGLACGRFSGWHLIQVLYYDACLVALLMALSLLSASVMPFFRDLGPIIGIALQFGMWLTPILWPVTMVPERFRWIFKFNPVNYVVEGYRDALLGGAWVWQHGPTTLGFWTVTGLLILLGRHAHRRLKPHFADVL